MARIQGRQVLLISHGGARAALLVAALAVIVVGAASLGLFVETLTVFKTIGLWAMGLLGWRG